MYAVRDKVAAEPGIELIVHQQSRGAGARDQPVRPRPAAHRHVEDRRAEAGARRARFRRGVRRRPARRGEEPGEGARVQLPRPEPPLGPQAAAAGAVVALQCPQSQGREHPRVPAVQLDRARRVAIYVARGDRGRAALFRRGAADGGARRPDPDGRRRAHAAGGGREGRDAQGAVPDARLLPAVGRGRERCGDASRTSSPRCWLPRPAERQGRAIDRDGGSASMEKKKQEGYF